MARMILHPILIAGPPRSGTTMLAGLLNLHDVWIGRARTTWYPGTNSNIAAENLDIKAVMKEEARQVGYRNWTVPLPVSPVTDNAIMWHKMEQIAPRGVDWLVKTSWTLVFEDFWNQMYEPKWILVDRPIFAIQDSMRRHPSMAKRPEKMRLRFIKALKERQDYVEVKWTERCARIDVQKVANKRHDEIQRLFDFIGIIPKWEVIDNFIEPRLFKKWKVRKK